MYLYSGLIIFDDCSFLHQSSAFLLRLFNHTHNLGQSMYIGIKRYMITCLLEIPTIKFTRNPGVGWVNENLLDMAYTYIF
jgi:hypothetical protein